MTKRYLYNLYGCNILQSDEFRYGVHFASVFLNFVQAILQTLFILDGSRRRCFTPEQAQRKPGRELVAIFDNLL